jgi:hypothetical protein
MPTHDSLSRKPGWQSFRWARPSSKGLNCSEISYWYWWNTIAVREEVNLRLTPKTRIGLEWNAWQLRIRVLKKMGLLKHILHTVQEWTKALRWKQWADQNIPEAILCGKRKPMKIVVPIFPIYFPSISEKCEVNITQIQWIEISTD